MALQERAIRTRRAILVAAAEVFDEVGYEAATITEILKRSGLTRQSPSPGEDLLVRRALAAAAIDADTVTVLETPDSAARTTGRVGAATGVAAPTRPSAVVRSAQAGPQDRAR